MATKSAQSSTLITPKGRLSFPSLLRPDTGGQYSDDKFKGTLLFDKKDPAVMESLKALNAACKKVAEEAFGKGVKVDMPFRDGNEKADKNEAYRDTIMITAKSKYKPDVVSTDPNVHLTEDHEIYGGCYCRFSVIAFSYSQGKNRGVSLRLNNVQKLADGEPFGGTRSNATEEFGGVAAPAGDEEKPFEEEDSLGL